VLRDVLTPLAAKFRPQLVLISCGFDLKADDAMGGRGVTARGVCQLTRVLMDIADRFCEGRIVSVLEGGYADAGSNPPTWYGLAACAEAHVRTLMTGKLQPEARHYRKRKAARGVR
jgi:acetoin utilization deacetylase AcuC-like enzyme